MAMIMLPVTDPRDIRTFSRRIQTALRQRRAEMVRGTLIGRGGHYSTATSVLLKTVWGDRKNIAENGPGGPLPGGPLSARQQDSCRIFRGFVSANCASFRSFYSRIQVC